jgi:hypothetical protein
MRSVWKLQESDYPHTGSIEDKIQFCLQYAILAPSAHNMQPWRFKINQHKLQIFQNEKYMLKIADPTKREAFLGIGACIENFVVATEYFGLELKVNQLAFINTDSLAAELVINQSGKTSAKDSNFFQGITRRHTNRGLYQANLPDETLIDKIKALPTLEGVRIFTITDREAKSRIAKLTGQGLYIALSLRKMREEMIDIVSKVQDQRQTGMYVEAMVSGFRNRVPMSWAGRKLVIKMMARDVCKRFDKTPLIIIIGSVQDGPTAWIQAGRVMEKILLLAAFYELNHDIAAAPVEIPTLTPKLRQEIDPEYRPQVLLRVGKPTNPSFTIPSNRRAPNES